MISFLAASDMRCSYSPDSERHISETSAASLDAFLSSYTSACRFIMNLGNISDGKASQDELCKVVESVTKTSKSTTYFSYSLLGELDASIGKEAFVKIVGSAMRYVAFEASEYRCILLDTCMTDPSDPYAPLDTEKGFVVDDEQLFWLSRLLDKNHRPAIIFTHFPLILSDSEKDSSLVKNSKKLRDVIEKSGKAIMVISGGCEKAELITSNDLPYINLAPMYDDNSFAEIKVSSRQIEIIGHGNQPSYTIPFPGEEPALIRKNFWELLKDFFSKTR